MTDTPPRLTMFQHLKDRGVLLSRRQIDRLEVQNKFPKRVPLGERRVAWVADEVDAWVDQKIKARSTEAGALGSDVEGRKGHDLPGRGDRGRFKPRDAGSAPSSSAK